MMNAQIVIQHPQVTFNTATMLLLETRNERISQALRAELRATTLSGFMRQKGRPTCEAGWAVGR